MYVIVVLPTGKRFPDGTPLRTTVTAPALSVAVALPSWASPTKTDDCVPVTVRLMLAGTVSTGRSVSATVIFCVFTVLLPKMSVAVHVIVVVPIANTFPAGTPERVNDASWTSSLALAFPIAASETTAVALPASVERVRSAGTPSVGGVESGESLTCVPIWTWTLSKDVVPVRLIVPRPPSVTTPLYENEPTCVPLRRRRRRRPAARARACSRRRP